MYVKIVCLVLVLHTSNNFSLVCFNTAWIEGPQYLTPGWFKIVFLYQAYNASDIPCPFPLWCGEGSPDWLERVG